MKIALPIVVIVFSIFTVAACTRLPPQWCAKILQLCEEFNDDQSALPTLRMCCFEYLEESFKDSILYLFPPVILWSPVEQFRNVLNLDLFCPKCSQLGEMANLLHASSWRSAVHGKRSEPRKIYGCGGVTLLVGRIYRCCKSHEVAGYHPGVLEQIPACFVPFRLWHVTGFTTEFIELVVTLISTGLSISGIRTFLYKKLATQYYSRKTQFDKAVSSSSMHTTFPSLNSWKECFASFLPSMHALSGCFLADFWKKDCTYTHCMQNTTIDESNPWLSLDHTFASSRNIGFSRIGDNRWITQYEALFCILNARGEVLSWKLTQKLSFAEVEADLTALKGRLQSQGKVLKEFYIDNCCSWRKKLQEVFGKELIVYLDIFHAVKRFSDKVPKRHPLRRECMREWKMVFRDPSDQGEKRMLPTPSPDILENNVGKFLQHWENAEYDGKKLLNASALKEIGSIRVHIKKGCLSAIKPGRGTNRNENLHKDLNKVMSSSKYGVELAYALLTVVLYNHNERMAATSEQRLEHPIEHHFQSSLPCTTERFGLKFTSSEHQQGCSSTNEFETLKLTSCTYKQLYHRILNTPIPQSGHSRQQDNIADDDGIHSLSNDPTTAEELEVESDDQFIQISFLKKVLMQAISWFFVHKCFQSVSETAHIRVDLIPFMVSTSSDLANVMHLAEEGEADEKIIDNLLKSWNLRRLKNPKDGNCLFHSVAYNMKLQVENGNVELKTTLDTLKIDTSSTTFEIAKLLRRCVVREWLSENSSFYQQFMTEGQLQIQADEFAQDGTYSIDIGDLVIAALSNVLQTPLVVFTARPYQPIFIQNPTCAPMVSSNPVYLAYLHLGPGHYDAVVPNTAKEDNTMEATNVHVGSCNCGRKQSKGSACSFSLEKYRCRCPCYNSKQSCSENCKCKGCTNTFGTRPPPKKTGQKRKRPPHDSQSTLLRGKKTVRFMEDVGEPVMVGVLSKMEFLVVCSITQALMADDLDWAQSSQTNSSQVLAIYDHILDLTKTLQLDIALYSRSLKDIEKLLYNASFKWDVFRQKNMML